MTPEVSSGSNNSNCETSKLLERPNQRSFEVYQLLHTLTYAYLMCDNSYIGNSTNRTQTEIIDLVAVVCPPTESRNSVYES